MDYSKKKFFGGLTEAEQHKVTDLTCRRLLGRRPCTPTDTFAQSFS